MRFAHDDEALALWLLRRDPVGAGLSGREQMELANIALADGRDVGATLRAAYGHLAPIDIAAALGVRVIETAEDPWTGPFLRHADYRHRPPEIRLFRKAITALESDCGLSLCPVFLAHELYHHVEASRSLPSLPRRHAMLRLRIGFWRLAAPVAALSEIAAGACARALLRLSYHPASLDLAVLARDADRHGLCRTVLLHGPLRA